MNKHLICSVQHWMNSFPAPLPKGSRKRLDIRYNSVRLKVRTPYHSKTMKGEQGMLNIRDLRIDPASLGEKMLLVEIIPSYEYKDGAKTNNISGYRYVVALPKHNLEKISVKIDGEQLMDKPESFVEVEFENLEVLAYEMRENVQISAKATGISLA